MASGIYLRVSSSTQDTKSQEPDLTTWAKAQAEEIVWYKDKATGTTMDRPGLDKLLADARAGKITKVVVWRLDRLGRTARGLLDLLDELQRLGVGFVSLREGIDLNTPAGRLMLVVLAADGFRKFYEAVDQADDVQQALMLRLLFYTGVRVSELCNMLVEDVDLDACKIRVNQGKGGKDRYVLFGKSFATALRTHLAAHPSNRWLFQTRRNSKFTTRRVQQIVKLYAEKAGVNSTPHTFRHQAITWLTRHSGLADAELQLITGHARRETLAVYQHVALDEDLEQRYQEAMRKVDL